MSNPYCEILRVEPSAVPGGWHHSDANTYARLILALMEEGGPLTLPEVAARFEEHGVASRQSAEQSLRRCRPGRPPVYRHGDRYYLDPHHFETDLWAFRLGLRPPRRRANDSRSDRSTAADRNAEPEELPGPDEPLQPEELEELWDRIQLGNWSAQRIALCVLEAYGAPMTPEEVVAHVEALHGPGHGFDREQPHFAWKNSAIEVLDDGRWMPREGMRSLRLAREAVRDELAKVRQQPDLGTKEDRDERLAEWRAAREATGLQLAQLRRAMVRGWPLDDPVVLIIVDVDTEGARILSGTEVAEATDLLADYDVLAGEEIRPLLEGLGVDFARRRLHELRPPQKTIVRNERGATLDVTMARLLKSSCGIERQWPETSTLDGWAAGGNFAALKESLADQAVDLLALYRYGRLHGAVRIRWYSLDEMIPVPWVGWDEWSAHRWMTQAAESGQPLEVSTHVARSGDPWADRIWCSVYSAPGYRDALVTAKRQIVPLVDVQRMRFAVPGPWHAPLPVDVTGPSDLRDDAGVPPVAREPMLLRVRVELDLGASLRPPWRVIELRAEASFWELHIAIQETMGWLDYHLHAFHLLDPDTQQRIEVGLPLGEHFLDEPEPLAGWTTPVLQYLNPELPECDYVYDFGDHWRHRVRLVAIAPQDAGTSYPRCVDGARACPPEDVGGYHGYQRFLDAIADPQDEEHDLYLQWCGGSFDPEAFDPSEVTFDHPGERWVVAFGVR